MKLLIINMDVSSLNNLQKVKEKQEKINRFNLGF